MIFQFIGRFTPLFKVIVVKVVFGASDFLYFYPTNKCQIDVYLEVIPLVRIWFRWFVFSVQWF
jgi:hypothetical protein